MRDFFEVIPEGSLKTYAGFVAVNYDRNVWRWMIS